MSTKTHAYPKPPTSGGLKAVATRTSRAWWDWWQSLNMQQRDQYIKDQIRGVYHYES